MIFSKRVPLTGGSSRLFKSTSDDHQMNGIDQLLFFKSLCHNGLIVQARSKEIGGSIPGA